MQRKDIKLLAVLGLVAIVLWTADAAFDAYFSAGRSFRAAFEGRMPFLAMLFRSLFISGVAGLAILYVRKTERRISARDELQKHMTAIETSMDGIAILSPDHEYLYANEAYANITGYRNPYELLGKTFELIYHEEQLAWIREHVFPALDKTGKWHGELDAFRKDGTLFRQDASITRLPDKSCVCVMRDITNRKRQEEELRRSERFLNNIFDSIHDPFCIFNADYTIIRANDAYARLKNKSVDDLIEQTCFQALEGRQEVCEGCVIRKTFQSGDPCAKEKRVTLKTGEALWLEIFTYPIVDEAGKVTHVIEYTRDVTDRKKSEEDRRRLIERLEYLSKTDGLTGLLNRRALTDQLAYEIDRARRYRAPLSLILCDLDNLKEINDTYGHLAGDTAIQLVSATLRNNLRNVDISGRYGGDEFLVIIPQTDIAGAQSIAEKIRASAQTTEVRLDAQKTVTISLSMGIAELGPDESIDSFINRVDGALYDSKNMGRNRITVAPRVSAS